MTNETQSFNTLKANVFGVYDRVTRVENLVENGTPDCNACCDAIDVWIEIKSPQSEPKRKTTALLSGKHKLTQEQANWFMRHHRARGRGFVYIDAPSRRYLIRGADADEVNTSTPEQLMLMAAWSCPVPTPAARWVEFREVLRK